MKKAYFIFLLMYFTSGFSVTPEQGLKRLTDGNGRYMQMDHPTRGQSRRDKTVSSQSPYAIIVSCSDSRVAPEIIFDEGIGDLFVIRVAGNVIGPIELDSIDYAAIYLNSSVILVMGHQNCGAVDAVIQGNTKDIQTVAKLIEPAVEEAKKLYVRNLLEHAIKMNAQRMKDFLLKTPAIEKLVKDKKIEVHAAYYDLETGSIEFLKN